MWFVNPLLQKIRIVVPWFALDFADLLSERFSGSGRCRVAASTALPSEWFGFFDSAHKRNKRSEQLLKCDSDIGQVYRSGSIQSLFQRIIGC